MKNILLTVFLVFISLSSFAQDSMITPLNNSFDSELIKNENYEMSLKRNSNNINEIIQQTGVLEIHSSARKSHPSQMDFKVTSMNENLQSTGVDADEIKMMLGQI